MAEPSIWPGADGKFTRRKLGEKLYLPSSDFDLRDPNCYLFRPPYNSLHDPHLKQHLHRKHIHDNLKDRNFITDDDMVICTQREYSKYHDYVEDIKNDFKTRQLRERQRKLLELREQGLISEDMSLEDIRMFLLTNKLPRYEEHQQPELRHPKKPTKKTRKKKDVPQKSTKNSRKKKDAPQNGQFQNEMIQPTCTYDRQQLHLIEQEIKHEFNRDKYLKEIQEKRSRREKIILERRAAVEQAEKDKLVKTLRNLDRMRVIKEDQSKLLNHIFCESTSDVPLIQPMQRRHTLTRLAPLQARGHDFSNQKTSSSDTKSSLASNTAFPKSPHLGKVKLPTIQHGPEVNKNATVTQTVLDYTMSTATQSQGETGVEAISSPTVNTEDTTAETLDHGKSFGFANKTKKIGAKISYDIYTPAMAFPSASCSPCNVAVFQSEEENGIDSLKEPEASRPHVSSDEADTQAGPSSAPYVSSSLPCVVLCRPSKDTMVPSQMSSMVVQPHSVQSSKSREDRLYVTSVAPNSTCSDANRVSEKGVRSITRSQSLPSFNTETVNGVIQYVTSTECKDKIIQTMRSHLKLSLSQNDVRSALHLKLEPEDKKAMKSMFERISKDLNKLLTREHILPLLQAETTGPSPDLDAFVTSPVNAAALQLVDTMFSEVQQQLTAKIMQESPLRGLSPLGSKTAINSICTSIEDMKRTVSNEMLTVFESEMLLPVSSEDTEMSSASSLSIYKVEMLAYASTALSTASVSPCSVADVKDEETGLVLLPVVGLSAPEISSNEIDSLADASADLSGATSSLSNLEVFKSERSPPVITQENEASTPVISAEEVEMLACASTALSTASVSLSSVADIKYEGAGFVLLPVAGLSAPEISSNEIDSPADASADLSGALLTLSNLQVFKTEEHQPFISQENEVSSPEISAEEVELLTYGSPAPSTASVSPRSVADIKDEEAGLVLLPVVGLSAPEISSNEIDSPADASADLSGATSSLRLALPEQFIGFALPCLSNLEVFKSERSPLVISQENEASTPVISAEEVEMLAYASTAPSTASVSLSSVADIKDEGAGFVLLPVAGLSAPEISSNEIDSPADASADLSGAASSLRPSLRVFKSERCQPVPSQEVTLEISSDKFETRLDASSTSCFAPSFPSAAKGAPTYSGTSQVPVRKKKCTAIKSLSLPSLFPAIADEVSNYFTTTSFKDRITQVVKNELKRSFSVNDLPSSTQHPKPGPEERRAIRNMLKRISKELDNLMSREHILSLLSAAETTERSSPEHDALFAQLSAAASRLIDEVFTEVKVKLATKIKQQSPKRGVSPVASQVAIKAACRSLEGIKRTLLGDGMCVASTSGIQLSVSSADKKVVEETSNARNFRTQSKIPSPPAAKRESTVLLEANVPSASSVRFQCSTSKVAAVSKTPHAAAKSLSLPNLHPTIVKEVHQHVNTSSFTDYIRRVVRKELKRSLSVNDARPTPQQTLGPEERRFIKNTLNNVSSELSALMTRHHVSPLSPETATPPSTSDNDGDDTLRRLNAVALELIHKVYAQVKEKLTIAIKQESPKRGLCPVASQTAANAACRALSAIEMTLMDRVRSPSTPALDLEIEATLEVENSSYSLISEDLIDDVISMFYMDTASMLSSRTAMPSQATGGGALLYEVVKESITMLPGGTMASSTERSDDSSTSLSAGPSANLLSSITDEIVQHFSTRCFQECLAQSLKNEVRQHLSEVTQDCMADVKDMMEIVVKSTYQKMLVHVNNNASDTLIVEDDVSNPAINDLPALEVQDQLSAQELASTIQQITRAVLNHFQSKLCDYIEQTERSLEDRELATHALNQTFATMAEYVSNIQFFKEELHCYICHTNNIPTQEMVGQWIPLSKLNFVSMCLATTVIDSVYHSDSSPTCNPSSNASPELEANSPPSEIMVTPSKPESPSSSRSFRARKWLSSSALERSVNTNPDTAVHSRSVGCLTRTDMESMDEDQLESPSSGSMSFSLVCSPLPLNLMSSMLQPKPPCKKRNQFLDQLADETTKTFGKRRVLMYTIFRNPEGLSDDESSCTSCSVPEDVQSSDESPPEEDPSCSPLRRHSI